MFFFQIIYFIYSGALEFPSYLIMGSAAWKWRWVLGTILPRQICVVKKVSNTFNVLSHVVAQLNCHGKIQRSRCQQIVCASSDHFTPCLLRNLLWVENLAIKTMWTETLQDHVYIVASGTKWCFLYGVHSSELVYFSNTTINAQS